MKSSTASRVAATAHCPLGLFLSEAILASIMFGATPTLQVRPPVASTTLDLSSSATWRHSIAQHGRDHHAILRARQHTADCIASPALQLTPHVVSRTINAHASSATDTEALVTDPPPRSLQPCRHPRPCCSLTSATPTCSVQSTSNAKKTHARKRICPHTPAPQSCHVHCSTV